MSNYIDFQTPHFNVFQEFDPQDLEKKGTLVWDQNKKKVAKVFAKGIVGIIKAKIYTLRHEGCKTGTKGKKLAKKHAVAVLTDMRQDIIDLEGKLGSMKSDSELKKKEIMAIREKLSAFLEVLNQRVVLYSNGVFQNSTELNELQNEIVAMEGMRKRLEDAEGLFSDIERLSSCRLEDIPQIFQRLKSRSESIEEYRPAVENSLNHQVRQLNDNIASVVGNMTSAFGDNKDEVQARQDLADEMAKHLEKITKMAFELNESGLLKPLGKLKTGDAVQQLKDYQYQMKLIVLLSPIVMQIEELRSDLTKGEMPRELTLANIFDGLRSLTGEKQKKANEQFRKILNDLLENPPQDLEHMRLRQHVIETIVGQLETLEDLKSFKGIPIEEYKNKLTEFLDNLKAAVAAFESLERLQNAEMNDIPKAIGELQGQMNKQGTKLGVFEKGVSEEIKKGIRAIAAKVKDISGLGIEELEARKELADAIIDKASAEKGLQPYLPYLNEGAAFVGNALFEIAMENISRAKREEMPDALRQMKALIENYGSGLGAFGVKVDNFMQKQFQQILQSLLLTPGDSAVELAHTKELVTETVERLAELSELKELSGVDFAPTLQGLAIYSGQLAASILCSEQISALMSSPLNSLPSTLMMIQRTLSDTGSSLGQLGEKTQRVFIANLKKIAERLSNEPGSTPQEISERKSLVQKTVGALKGYGSGEVLEIASALEKAAINFDAASNALAVLREGKAKVGKAANGEMKMACFKSLCENLMECQEVIRDNPYIGEAFFEDFPADQHIMELIELFEAEIESRMQEIGGTDGERGSERSILDFEQKVSGVTRDIHRYIVLLDSFRKHIPGDGESLDSLRATLEEKLIHGASWTKDLRKNLWDEWYKAKDLEKTARAEINIRKFDVEYAEKKLNESEAGYLSAFEDIKLRYKAAHDQASGRLLGKVLEGADWSPSSGTLSTADMMERVLEDASLEPILSHRLAEIADQMPDALLKADRLMSGLKWAKEQRQKWGDAFLRGISSDVDVGILLSPPISLSKEEIVDEEAVERTLEQSVDQWKGLASAESAAKGSISMGLGWISSFGRQTNEQRIQAMAEAYQPSADSDSETQKKFDLLKEKSLLLAKALDYHASHREVFQQKAKELREREAEANAWFQQADRDLQHLIQERAMINSFQRAKELLGKLAPVKEKFEQARARYSENQELLKRGEAESARCLSYVRFLNEYVHLLYKISAAAGYEDLSDM